MSDDKALMILIGTVILGATLCLTAYEFYELNLTHNCELIESNGE